MTAGLDRQSLLFAYWDFCLATDSENTSEGQLLSRVCSVGIQRYRESVCKRHWRYPCEPKDRSRL